MTHDEELLDAVAALALGVLPASEAADVTAHVRTCESCRALYADLRPVADLVGLSATAAVNPDRVAEQRRKARVMQSVRSTTGAPATQRPARGWVGWAFAAAAAVVAVAVGLDDGTVRDDRAKLTARESSFIARLATSEQARVAAQERLLAFVGPGAHRYEVAQGVVATNADHVFVAVALPALPAGKVYQAWTLAAGAKAVAPSSTFSPDENGVAVIELPEHATGIAAVAVSVEPAGGSKAPTSTPKFVRKLS